MTLTLIAYTRINKSKGNHEMDGECSSGKMRIDAPRPGIMGADIGDSCCLLTSTTCLYTLLHPSALSH